MGGEEVDFFGGVGKIAGGACVAPAIVEFVTIELDKSRQAERKGSGREGAPPERDQQRRWPASQGPREAPGKVACERRRGVA